MIPSRLPGHSSRSPPVLVHVQHDICLVLADRPLVSLRVLKWMLATAIEHGDSSGVVLTRDDWPQQALPLLIRARHAYPHLVRTVSAGERRLRAVLEMPGQYAVPERVWRAADNGHGLRDLGTPAEYDERLSPKTSSTATTI